MNRREFAGTIVRDEATRLRVRAGLRSMDAVARMAMMSRATVTHVIRGDERVSLDTYAALEAAFGLPTHFFDAVLAGDVGKIERMPNLREDLRAYVVEGLRELSGEPWPPERDRRRRKRVNGA